MVIGTDITTGGIGAPGRTRTVGDIAGTDGQIHDHAAHGGDTILRRMGTGGGKMIQTRTGLSVDDGPTRTERIDQGGGDEMIRKEGTGADGGERGSGDDTKGRFCHGLASFKSEPNSTWRKKPVVPRPSRVSSLTMESPSALRVTIDE